MLPHVLVTNHGLKCKGTLTSSYCEHYTLEGNEQRDLHIYRLVKH